MSFVTDQAKATGQSILGSVFTGVGDRLTGLLGGKKDPGGNRTGVELASGQYGSPPQSNVPYSSQPASTIRRALGVGDTGGTHYLPWLIGGAAILALALVLRRK